MRRKDRERTSEAFFAEVLDEAGEIFLAINDGEFPYGVIVNFVRDGDFLYVHSAKDGKKMSLLRADGAVAFCAACGVRVDGPRSTTRYKSVYGTGRAVVLEDMAEKRRALDLLARRYDAACKVPVSPETAERTAVIRIEMLSLSGKANEID